MKANTPPTSDRLRRIGNGLVTNFTGLAPLGTVLVALLGTCWARMGLVTGLAEGILPARRAAPMDPIEALRTNG